MCFYAWCLSAEAPLTVGPPQGQPLPPDYGPPPYEASLQPGFLPPHVPGDGPMPMPMLSPHGMYTEVEMPKQCYCYGRLAL